MKNDKDKNPCFIWYVLPIIEWNIQVRQYCKSAKHTSLTTESDPMFISSV